MTENDIKSAGEEVVKTKRKGNGKNSPVIGNNGFMTEPGDNSKAISQIMGIYNMPKIDINSDDEVEQRIQEYFTYCFNSDLKPGVEGMALALGVSRRTLWDWENENSRASVDSSRSNIIKKAKLFLSNYMENLTQNGKINPITAIFLMKNHFGYADKQEVVITPNNHLDAAQTPEQIAEQIQSDIPIDID